MARRAVVRNGASHSDWQFTKDCCNGISCLSLASEGLPLPRGLLPTQLLTCAQQLRMCRPLTFERKKKKEGEKKKPRFCLGLSKEACQGFGLKSWWLYNAASRGEWRATLNTGFRLTFLNIIKLPTSFKGASPIFYHISQVVNFVISWEVISIVLSPLLSGFVSCDFLIFVS